MKTPLLVGAALAFLGLAAAPLSAQTQTTTSTTSSSGYIQTSKIIGTKVKSSSGEEIGVVKDVVIDRSTGCMAYTVVSAGGTGTRITGQAKTVVVPWTVYSTTSTDPSILTVTVDRDRIYNAPVFDYARIAEYTTPVFIGTVNSYYGVSSGGVSGGVYGTTTTGATSTTTGTSTTATGATSAGASATPMATPMATAAGAYGASPAATASPATSASPAASPAASTTASPRASASPRATRGGAAREEGASGRGKAHVSPAASPAEDATGKARTGTTSETGMSPAESSRTRGEGVREKAVASPAETEGSPSGERKKARRHRGEESPTTGASPSASEEQE